MHLLLQRSCFGLARDGNQVGLRPLTIFGVGREIGLTSGPTKAVKAAILGRRFEIEAPLHDICGQYVDIMWDMSF